MALSTQVPFHKQKNNETEIITLLDQLKIA